MLLTGDKNNGFTLIELSIVLVIIGLIVGGVLVGRDLINAAAVRAQITQIEKYNQAVNTFRGKYAFIPGDMLWSAASQFGFNVGTYCDGTAGKRDGNGLITGYISEPMLQLYGETALFWSDLTSSATGSQLIEGEYPNNGWVFNCSSTPAPFTGSQVSSYFPAAKIGYGNYIYVYSYNSLNWYTISAITGTTGGGGYLLSNANIPVLQAYKIDSKMDDGMAASGIVQAFYVNNSIKNISNAPSTTTAGGNSSSCYDTTTNAYSIAVSGGANPNCALSFQFQ